MIYMIVQRNTNLSHKTILWVKALHSVFIVGRMLYLCAPNKINTSNHDETYAFSLLLVFPADFDSLFKSCQSNPVEL